MFKDIHLSIDNNKVNFGYAIDKDKIIIKTIDELQIGNILKIFYDENIYDIKLNKNTKKRVFYAFFILHSTLNSIA